MFVMRRTPRSCSARNPEYCLETRGWRPPEGAPGVFPEIEPEAGAAPDTDAATGASAQAAPAPATN